MSWLLIIPAILATALSIGGLTPIATMGHKHTRMPSMCEMAAVLNPRLGYFRFILWTCGSLFAITMYGWVVPRSSLPLLTGILWTFEYVGDIMIAAIPARPKTMKAHLFFAQLMGFAMLALAFLFGFTLPGLYAAIQFSLAAVMTVLGALTYLDRKHYVFYQAPFIYLSHFSIITAALALH